MITVKDLTDKDLVRVEQHFKALAKQSLLDSAFKPDDIMYFNVQKKLVAFNKKELLEEALLRRKQRRINMIKERLREMNNGMEED